MRGRLVAKYKMKYVLFILREEDLSGTGDCKPMDKGSMLFSRQPRLYILVS